MGRFYGIFPGGQGVLTRQHTLRHYVCGFEGTSLANRDRHITRMVSNNQLLLIMLQCGIHEVDMVSLNITKLLLVSLLTCLSSFLCNSSETSNSRTNSNRTGSRKSVGATGNCLTAGSACPDSSTLSLYRVLSTKDATISRMLRNLNLSNEFTESGTITSSVFSGDSDLLGTLSHFVVVLVLKTAMQSILQGKGRSNRSWVRKKEKKERRDS